MPGQPRRRARLAAARGEPIVETPARPRPVVDEPVSTAASELALLAVQMRPGKRAPDDEGLKAQDHFDDLLDLSLQRALDIMRLDPTTIQDEKVLAKIVSEQRQIAASVISAQVRIDEAKLRRQSTDKLSEILKAIKQEKDALAEPVDPASLF
jgi:hypothetical protein